MHCSDFEYHVIETMWAVACFHGQENNDDDTVICVTDVTFCDIHVIRAVRPSYPNSNVH